MSQQACFFISIGMSLIVWTWVCRQYVWPRLRVLPPDEALRPILLLHSFRFEGLAFLIPGVVSAQLPGVFAHAAGYGDFIAALLALVALVALRYRAGLVMVWIFNLWGTADLLDAFFQANRSGLVPGQLQVLYVIPTLFVPLLLVTHVMAFRILVVSPDSDAISSDARAGDHGMSMP